MIYTVPTLRQIMHEVSRASGVSLEMLRSDRRNAKYVHARMAYCWLAREFTAKSWPQIARAIYKDHSSAISAARRCGELIDRARDDDAAVWALEVQHYLNLKSTQVNIVYRDEGEAMRAIWT